MSIGPLAAEAVTSEAAATDGDGPAGGSTGSPGRRARQVHRLVLGACAVAAVVVLAARFHIRSPLWLDESLSVNIARLPIGRIPAALRHDGHPPLYYVLLHGWMSVFGSGDLAVRSLSAVASLLCLPLAYRAGRRVGGPRLGWTTVMVLSLSPYFLRYGSEARMYSLLMLGTFAGYLLVSQALEQGRPAMSVLAGIAVVTGAMLWTHYWSMWLLMGTGLLLCGRIARPWVLAARARRRAGTDAADEPPTVDRPRIDRGATAVLVAMAVGAVTFLPWVPNMLYQAAHTGTPWAKTFRPSTLIVQSWQEFSGGPYSEPQVLALVLVAVFVVGLFGRSTGAFTVDLDFRTRREARRPALALAATAAVACAGGIASHTTFAPRYAAVFFPFVILLLALGLDRFEGRVVGSVVLSVFLVLSLVGNWVVYRLERTQAGVVAEAIRAQHDPGALLVICPDQLGPSVGRAVGTALDTVVYPETFPSSGPLRVDWVDYAARNRRNDPVAFAQSVLARAGNRRIYVVESDDYKTLAHQCGTLVSSLVASHRRPTLLVSANADDYFEPMSVYSFDPQPPPG